MKIIRYFRVALESILANKLRASLTMLGIILGVAAVLTTMGIGSGAAASITSQIESQGTNLLTISAGSSRGGGGGGATNGNSGTTTLTVGDAGTRAKPPLHPEQAMGAPEES